VLRRRLKAADHKLADGEPFHTQLPNAHGTRVSLAAGGPGQFDL